MDPVKNFGFVTVSIGYDASANSIVLSSGHGARLPDPVVDGSYNLTWYDDTLYPNPANGRDTTTEIVRVTGPAGTGDTKTIVRAQENTSATVKNTTGSTFKMFLGSTAKTITDISLIKLDDFGTPDDNTDLDFSTSRHGLTPKGTNTGNYLKDDGTWGTPAGGGDMLKATYDPSNNGYVDSAGELYDASGNKTYSDISTEVDTDVAAHADSDGSSHTYIDQDVTSGAEPTFDGGSITNIDADTLIVDVKEENVSAITKGQACSITGSSGSKIEIGLADCDDSSKIRCIGVAQSNITQNADGIVVFKGLITNVDTQIGNTDINPGGETWTAGDLLWLSTTAGGLTNIRPTSGRSIKVAYTVKGNSASDSLLVIAFTNPINMNAASDEDVVIRLGDDIGVKKLLIKNYSNVEKAAIDSSGNITTSGTVDGVDIVTHVGNADAHHNESHNVASHSDTSVTGAELNADHTKLATIDVSANDYTHPNHTGDVTSTGDGATAISSGVIVNADVSSNAAIETTKVAVSTIGTPTYDDAQDFMNLKSAGIITGGLITDSGSGQIDIAAGTGIIKVADSVMAETKSFDWDASLNFSLTDGQVSYVYIDYNAGSPVIAATIDRTTIEQYRQFTLGRVCRDGTDIKIINSGNQITDHDRETHERLIYRGIQHADGAVISETGTRNLASTAGVLYLGNNSLTSAAQDTSVADTITRWYHTSGSWDSSTNAQIDNTHYDNGTDLTELGTGRYGVHWIFVCGCGGDLKSVYGQGNYTITQAENASVPSGLPDCISKLAILAAKVIILKGASSFTSIVSAYETLFPVSSPSSHNDLGGIQGGAAGDYYHLTNAQHTILATNTPTADRVLIADASGNVDSSDNISLTELGYLDGVTSGIQTQLNAKAASGSNSDITELTGLTTDLSIAQGGTGQSTAQAAIDALSAVAGATNEHVLTKDTATGNAKFKASSAGFADPMTTRGDIIIKDASNNTARLGIGSNTQVLKSDGTDILWGAAGGAPVDSVFGRIGVVDASSNDYTWAQINKGTSDIADITTKSHASLTDIGTTSHADLDTDHTKLATIDVSANDYTHPNHTGDVTSVGDGVTAIADGVIVNADVSSNAAIDVTKLADGTVTDTEFQYINSLSSNAQDQIAARVTNALFDANTIIKADSDNTPAALTVAEQTLVGRITAGVITALTAAQVRTLIGVADGADVTGDNAPQTHAMATHTDDGALATKNTVGTTEIDNDSVTYAKMQNVVADERILGNVAAADSVVTELTKAQVLTMLNVIDGADVTGSNTPQAHAASHQNAGSDEISVAGLSGLLADGQTPLAHDLDSHNSCTLAQLSADISDATLASTAGTETLTTKKYQLNDALGTNHTAEGTTIEATAGENSAFGDLVYMKDDGKWWHADADAATTMPGAAMVLENILANGTGELLLYGVARNDSWTWSLGGSSGLIYASCTSGELTQTAPSGSGDQVQVVAYATTATSIIFNPSLVLVEIV